MSSEEYPILKTGKCNFYITSIMEKDKEGKPLITQKGSTYKKIKLLVTDRSDNNTIVWDPIFNSEKLEQLVKSVEYHSLDKKVNVKNIELSDLIGASGQCVVGVKQNEKYGPQNTIECYIRKSFEYVPQPQARTLNEQKAIGISTSESWGEEPDPTLMNDGKEVDDEIPF